MSRLLVSLSRRRERVGVRVAAPDEKESIHQHLIRWLATLTLPSPASGRGFGRGFGPTLILLAVLALAGCGKKGVPVAPGPADQIIYPHVYPSL